MQTQEKEFHRGQDNFTWKCKYILKYIYQKLTLIEFKLITYIVRLYVKSLKENKEKKKHPLKIELHKKKKKLKDSIVYLNTM